MKIKILPIVTILVIAFASFKAGQVMGKQSAGSGKAGGPGGGGMMGMAPPGGMPVTAIKVKLRPLNIDQEWPGRTMGHKVSIIRPQVDGVIQKRLFEEGSMVKKGQQLYEIDPSLYEAAFDQAIASEASAKSRFNRYQELLNSGAISKQEYDDAKAAFYQARAQAKTARTNFGYSKVYAPISGYITHSNVTEGALVNKNQADPIATIAQLDPMYVDIALPSGKLSAIKKYKDIGVSLLVDGKEYEHEGKFSLSEVVVDPSTDAIHLRTIFPNPDHKLLTGMFVSAMLHSKIDNVIYIPQRVVDHGPDGGAFVWIVGEGNVVKQQKIKADEAVGNQWIVTEGLKEGDIIVFEGLQKIGPGAKVNPTIVE